MRKNYARYLDHLVWNKMCGFKDPLKFQLDQMQYEHNEMNRALGHLCAHIG